MCCACWMPQQQAEEAARSWEFRELLLLWESEGRGKIDWEAAMGLFQGIVDYLAPLL